MSFSNFQSIFIELQVYYFSRIYYPPECTFRASVLIAAACYCGFVSLFHLCIPHEALCESADRLRARQWVECPSFVTIFLKTSSMKRSLQVVSRSRHEANKGWSFSNHKKNCFAYSFYFKFISFFLTWVLLTSWQNGISAGVEGKEDKFYEEVSKFDIHGAHQNFFTLSVCL